jgi:hypothetical protein
MDWIVSIPDSYVEALTPMAVFRDRAFKNLIKI